VARLSSEVDLRAVEQEGAAFTETYCRDAQYVSIRVQHHVHRRTKRGYEPLRACRPKGKKCAGTCKAGFPMKGLLCKEPLLVCRGIAKDRGLRITGRRNSFGCIIGRRRCEWQSGTHPCLAVIFGSNAHTAPNFRVPVIPETHDDAA